MQSTRSLSLIFLASVCACSFDGGGASQIDAAPDADTDAAEQRACEDWGDRGFFDACADLGMAPGALTLSNNATIETATGNLIVMGQVLRRLGEMRSLDGVPTRVIHAESIDVTGKIRVIGDLPVAFLSNTTLTVSGVLNVSSFWSDETEQFSDGAAANEASCVDAESPIAPGIEGDSGTDGGGGGGGAGFGRSGGAGGDGGVDRTQNDGSNGGSAIALEELTLRGGCRGGRGGEGEDSGSVVSHIGGVGGSSGGAVLLSAVESISLTGSLLANGAGGRGQEFAHRNGAGGGGSGGLVVVEAPSISIGASGSISANGGGGGGGANNLLESPQSVLRGGDGEPGLGEALGAAGEDLDPRGSGGRGGARVEASLAGSGGDRGGGGGGGEVGYVLFIGGASIVGTVLSPEPMTAVASDFD